MLPANHAEVFHTQEGTPYLKEAGVVMISRPYVDLFRLHSFLEGFGPELGFVDYIDEDEILDLDDPGTKLCKTAGQLCYMSFGPKRTKNADAERYFRNIISSGHGSVLEHANFSFLFYGVSRSLTHELVRHRAGMAYSQVSQRYVDGSKLRFVERPEFQKDSQLHEAFEVQIDGFANLYDLTADRLRVIGNFDDMHPTDARKKVNQSARSVLPNETEAPIISTGNVRAWRHILEMRGSPHAETEVRNLAVKVYDCLVYQEPILFMDFHKETIDGEECIVRVDL